MGLAADVGTLQRLPKVTGNDSLVREWCYTGRKVDSKEAERAGLVSQVFDTKEEMMKYGLELGAAIASKSPIAIRGTKLSLNYSRDHSIQEGLNHIALLNSVFLQSEDLTISLNAISTSKKRIPKYNKL